MKLFLTFIATLLVATMVATERKSYKGYKLYKVTIKDRSDMELLQKIENTDNQFDIWDIDRESNGGASVTIMLSPQAQSKYLGLMRARNYPIQVINENMQDMIDQDLKTIEFYRIPEGTPRNIIGKFARYSEIMNYIQDIVQDNPSIASFSDAGKTYEGRNLRVIRLSNGVTPKPCIYVDCNVHSREWATHPICIQIINNFVNGWNQATPFYVNILNKFELHIMPLANPDGYEYSVTNDRYWRKNRSKDSALQVCIGVDPNRNTPADLGLGGSSNIQCSDTYMGKGACSEAECKAFDTWLKNLKSRPIGGCLMNINFHSYGAYYLVPPGSAPNKYTPDHANHLNYGNIFDTAASSVNGLKHSIGTTADLLYVATGSFTDHAYNLGVKVSTTIEVRPKNTDASGTAGFNLPESQVPSCIAENIKGFEALLTQLNIDN
jgi:hypothetical protein